MSVNGYFGGEGAMKQEVKERSAEMRIGAEKTAKQLKKAVKSEPKVQPKTEVKVEAKNEAKAPDLNKL
jgi:hypothetical protein